MLTRRNVDSHTSVVIPITVVTHVLIMLPHICFSVKEGGGS
jgi:hypothetical protein